MAARHANGSIEAIADKSDDLNPRAKFQRWHAAPIAVDIPTGYEGEDVEINLQDLDDPTELCMLLENEKAERKYWVTIALAYAKQGQLDYALDVLARGLQILSRAAPKDRLTILSCMSWIHLLKSRQAPRVPGEGPAAAEVKTKEHWLKEATNVMNEATRINPAYPPLYLTRGVLNLLRASLATSTKTGPGADAERIESLNQALKNFDEAIKSSDGRNLLALMGRARALYLLRRYQQALQAYQSVLGKMPDLRDPDPRIGIGCCMWQLGYHDNARVAWDRSVALNPKSVAAHSLLGVYYLREAGKYPSDTKEFETNYRKAMAIHLKTAYTLDKQYPLSCSVFSTYFLATKRYDHMETMARKAIEQTEMNALASDGWFTIARKEHALGDTQKAIDAYTRADQARGGQNAGYFPAKFGLVQLMIQSGEIHEAKFRLEKMFERHKAVEIMTLLGIIYAEEAFAALKINPKEDRSTDIKKALRMFESVRRQSKDEKAKIQTKPDPTVLLYLARLYEIDNPVESAKCLAEVELLQQKAIGEDNIIDPSLENYHELIQEQMPPQLHNNIGCFYYADGAYESALQRFEIALNATLKLHEKQAEERKIAEEEGNAIPETSDFTDTDALVTTISFNLARTQEALGNREDAARTYEGLLSKRHPDYTDASARLAYIASQDSPHELGPAKMKSLYSTNESDREVQALFEWYQHISKSKINFELGKDSEYIHYKKTLQEYDKHDVYALVGMGNLHLSIAREMPRNTDSEKEKRSKTYQKAYEFFDKALQLDPRNAYAAQGVAVALCDDKKSYSDAIQILVKVKDTIRDASVFQNLGHVYAELRQWQRSIDNYETALRKQADARTARAKNADSNRVNGHDAQPNGNTSVHPKDVHLLAALSRVWFMRGKADKSILSLNTSLDLMQKALSTEPDSPHLRFNVAFIQFNIVQMLNALSESERTLEDMTIAKSGLEEAIATFEDVANAKKPPYPKAMLEQRAAMSKGTMMRQLERSLEKQSEYEHSNATKLEEAKKRRAEEISQREAAAARRQAEDRAREEEVSRKRAAIIEEAEKQAEILRQEALQRELAEMTTDEETGERVKRQKKSKRAGGGRKRKDREDDGFIEHDEDSDASGPARPRTPLTESEGEGAERPQKKKRKLERKGGTKAVSAKKEKQGKYKSEAVIVDSDESDEEEAVATPKGDEGSENGDVPTPAAVGDGDGDASMMEVEEEVEAARPRAPRQRKQLRTIADDDEDGEDGEDAAVPVSRGAPRIVDDDEDS